MTHEQITELFDKDGNCIGALLTAEMWAAAKPIITKELCPNLESEPEIKPEPIADWEYLCEYWDFQYPPDYDVACGHCGATTDDWSKDTPRKFRLKASSLSGLVTFQCEHCKSRITKRHFKDEIVSETAPFLDAKDTNKEARY